MDYKPLPIGIDNFEKLITRPRRFGKTLNMSMLQYYFEDMRDEFSGEKKDNSFLFKGLKISEEDEKYTEKMGKYPVINLSLKSGKQGTFDLAYLSLTRRISEEFERHKYILQSDLLKDKKERYERIIRNEGTMGDYIDSIYFLSECLEKYLNKKVIILIDEYDVPLENAFFEGFYDEMIKFIRSLFESALKTNSSLEFAVITGCLRISRESIYRFPSSYWANTSSNSIVKSLN